MRCVLERSSPNRIGLFPLALLNRSILNRSVFKMQTQLNRKCQRLINHGVLVPLRSQQTVDNIFQFLMLPRSFPCWQVT